MRSAASRDGRLPPPTSAESVVTEAGLHHRLCQADTRLIFSRKEFKALENSLPYSLKVSFSVVLFFSINKALRKMPFPSSGKSTLHY